MATSDIQASLEAIPPEQEGLRKLREALEADDLRIEISWAFVLSSGDTQQARLSVRDPDTNRWRRVDLPPILPKANGTRSDLLRILADVLDAPFSWLAEKDSSDNSS